MFLVEAGSVIDGGEVTVWHAGTRARRLRVAPVQPRTLPGQAALRPRLVLRSACRCLAVVLALTAARSVARGEVTISNGRGAGSVSISSYHFTPVSGVFGLGCGPTVVRADLDNGIRIAHLRARGETTALGATCTHFPDGYFTGDATSASVSLQMSGSVQEVTQDTGADLGASGGLRITGRGEMKRYTITILDTAPPDDFSIQTTRTVWNSFGKIYARASDQNVGSSTIVIEDFNLDLWVGLTCSVKTGYDGHVPTSIDMNMAVTVAIEDLCSPNNTFTWDQPAGGSYSDATNWDPECSAPPRVDAERSDTAVFGLGGTAGIISIVAGGATAGRWIVADTIETSGLARLLGSSQTEPSLTVRGGGVLSIGDSTIESIHADIGEGNLQGRVTVGGYRSSWKNTGLIRLGGVPDAKLDVLLGGQVETADLEVGTGSGSTGAIEVRSVNTSSTRETLLKVNGTLTIANGQGAGTLAIIDGGRVEAGHVVVTDNPLNGADSITISGMSGNRRSTLQVNGNLEMAGGGAPTRLEVLDGAQLLTTGPVSIRTGSILVNNTASGLPPLGTVSGGASWTAQGPINLGGLGSVAELIVEDGGVVTAGEVVVGQVGGTGAGRVTVSDAGSLLFLGDLVVGAGGEGNVVISDGARVDSGASAVGGVTSGSVTINSQGSTTEWHVRGNVDVGIVGSGTILLQDAAFFSDARLSVGGTLTVGSSGAIMGNGTLDVPPPNRVVLAGGVISPGLSPGQITIEGDYEQQEGGVLVIEVAGLEPGQFDVLEVTGNATLAGKVQIKFIDGYVPNPGDAIDCLQVGGTTTGQLAVETLDADGQPSQVGATAQLTPEGVYRLTIGDASADTNGDTTADADGLPAINTCGGGTCGAGVTTMLPLSLVAMGRWRWRLRRRESDGRSGQDLKAKETLSQRSN